MLFTKYFFPKLLLGQAAVDESSKFAKCVHVFACDVKGQNKFLIEDSSL